MMTCQTPIACGRISAQRVSSRPRSLHHQVGRDQAAGEQHREDDARS